MHLGFALFNSSLRRMKQSGLARNEERVIRGWKLQDSAIQIGLNVEEGDRDSWTEGCHCTRHSPHNSSLQLNAGSTISILHGSTQPVDLQMLP